MPANATQPSAEHWARAETWHQIYVERARMLWSSDYTSLLEAEKLEAPILWEATAAIYGLQQSSYRRRMTNERLIERYDAKADKQVRDNVAILRRRQNQNVIPFSVLARSISYFNQRVPQRVWADQSRSLRIGKPCVPGHAGHKLLNHACDLDICLDT
jgi:hypothetical protein